MKKISTVLLLAFLFTLFACAKDPAEQNQPQEVPQGYIKEQNFKMFEASAETGIYNYCPSVIEENGARHVYYCTNKKPGNVTDYIGYRKAVLIDGEWYYSPETLVLEPTADTWDSRHTCDPDVIKGEFNYKSEKYSYLMAYLGCVTSNNQDNEVGIAIAKSPEGPWIKPDEINPVVKWTRNMQIDQSLFQWGYGQPSLVSVDKKGEVLLFYTAGTHLGTYTVVERIDFSDIENPVWDEAFWDGISPRGIKINTRGLFMQGGQPDILNNADFGYDPVNNRFYAIGEAHPIPAAGDSDTPTFISTKLKIIYYGEDAGSSSFKIGDTFKNQSIDKRWTLINEITPSVSGFKRNHNAALVLDAYGHMPQSAAIEAAYSVSDVNKPSDSLWTYRIYRYKFNISSDFLP